MRVFCRDLMRDGAPRGKAGRIAVRAGSRRAGASQQRPRPKRSLVPVPRGLAEGVAAPPRSWSRSLRASPACANSRIGQRSAARKLLRVFAVPHGISPGHGDSFGGVTCRNRAVQRTPAVWRTAPRHVLGHRPDTGSDLGFCVAGPGFEPG
jgi:hypothetical protein